MRDLMTRVCASCLSLWDALAIAELRSSSRILAAFLFVRSSVCMASAVVMPLIILQIRLAFFGAMRTAWRYAFMIRGECVDYLAGAAGAGARGAPHSPAPLARQLANFPPCSLHLVVQENSPSLWPTICSVT